MADTRDLAAVLAAAEEAAAAGDAPAAEKLLREAASIQEVSLGPLHVDLANTLNNLAVVCEITDKPADAERYYRRAANIAAKILDADHPFVATSQKNLEDFCAARGVPVEPPAPPPPPPAAAAPKSAPAARVAQPERKERGRPVQLGPPVVPPPRRSNPLAIGGAIVGGLAIVMYVAIRTLTGDAPSPSSPTAAAASSPAPVPATPAPGTPVATIGASEPPAAQSRTGPAPPGVVNARLCSTLTTGTVDWSCETATPPIGRGPIYFYTRLTTPRDTVVQHRWFRDGQLQQAVDLAISANQGLGYRTYSRTVLDSFSTGEWRVELRSKDGALLYEVKFTVSLQPY